MSPVLPLIVVLWMLHSSGSDAQQDAASERIRRAQAVLASTLDPALPAIPLDVWIRQAIGSSARYQWAEGACSGPRRSENAPVGICGILWAVAPDVAVTLSVRVGARDPDTEKDRWEPAMLHEAFIERGRNTLTIERLADLTPLMKLPLQDWPKRDIRVEHDGIRCSPDVPVPLDSVACSVVVWNPGDTTVHARVFVEVQPYPERGSEFVVKIPPHEYKSLKIGFEWPRDEGARISLGVELLNRSPYHRYDERGDVVLQPRSVLEEQERMIEQGTNGDFELEPILIAKGALTGTSRTFDLPVDTSISRLIVTTELDRGLVATLFRPGGVAVIDQDRDVTRGALHYLEVGRTAIASRSMFAVTRPQAGIWRLEVTRGGDAESGTFALAARGTSPISFNEFEFVRLQEFVHGGYFAVPDTMPIAGTTATARAELWRGPAGASFRMIDESGTTLQALALRKDDPHSSPNAPVGPMTVPSVPFSIVLDATDAAGARIQRQFHRLFRPQTVAVSFTFDRTQLPEVAAGAVQRFRFEVKNFGASAATFALAARTSLGEIRDLSPATIVLEPGGSASPTFDLVVPAKASPLHSIYVRLTATDVSDSTLSNSTTFTLEVARPSDSGRDPALDRPAQTSVVRRF